MIFKKCALALVCLFFGFALSAQVFTPLRPLFTLKTEHFVIIFPETCRSSAEYLYSMADDVFDEVAGKLDVTRTRRIPVMITDDSEEPNGEMSPFPLRIELYQAPISPDTGFAQYNDNLRKLFLHELSHALSMTISSPFWSFMSALFCPDLPIMVMNCPDSFVEGVTVSFESADGYGRANDTPFAAIIRQDIIEQKFKSFDEASGAWGDGEYSFGIHYIYGGYFSRYLQETYGLELYSALWHQMGKANFISGFKGCGPFKGDFEKVYGISVEKAWADFARYMALSVPVVTELDVLSKGNGYYSAIASDGKKIYVNETAGFRAYDPVAGTDEKLFTYDGSISRISPSPDGNRLLISQYRAGTGGNPKEILRVYDLRKRSFEKTEFPARLIEAAWLPDGSIVAIKILGYTQDLVRVRDGNEEVLFHGTESLCPAQPYSHGDGEIAFLLQRRGDASVARMNLQTKEVSLLTGDPAMKRVRNLFSDGETISFVFDSSDSLLRLARYADGRLEVEQTLISGGVQNPVTCAQQTYYLGYFSGGQRLLRYDETNPSLALKTVPSSWQAFTPDAKESVSVYDALPTHDAKKYSPIPWLFKPYLRYPVIGMNLDEFVVNGAGFSSRSMDPTESWEVSASALYRWNSQFADASVSASAKALPVPVTVSASDSLSAASGTDVYGEKLVRTLGANITFSKTIAFMPATRAIGFTLSGGASLSADGEGKSSGIMKGEAIDSPYGWDFTDVIIPLRGALLYQHASARPFSDDGPAGYVLGALYSGYLPDGIGEAPMGALTAQVNTMLPWLNFSNLLSSSFATGTDVLVGTTGAFLADGSTYRGIDGYTKYKEYSDRGSDGSWLYLYQDTNVSRVFKTHSPLVSDVYMRSIAVGGGYRSALADWEYLHSAYMYFDLNFCIARGMITSMFPLKERIEISVPMSNEDKTPQVRFVLMIDL